MTDSHTATSSLPVAMLVDDHAVVRAGFRMLLELSGHFSRVMEMDDGESLLALYGRHKPDIVIMDINLPGVSGIELTRRLLQQDATARVLVFSIHDEPLYVSRALAAGAGGYLCKSCATSQMIPAVLAVLHGETFVDPRLAVEVRELARSSARDPVQFLSAREFEVFQLLGRGLSSREIAETLGITVKTASNYLIVIKEKLLVGSTSELVRIASGLSAERHASHRHQPLSD
ncbi:MAG: hypothetical protein RIQ52_722 [Pseudomonadota bacterium]